MNKLLAGAASAAMFLALAAPTFAWSSNTAVIMDNDVTVSAVSGGNEQKAKGVFGGVTQKQTTGASSACGVQVIGANVTVGYGSGKNFAMVGGNDLGVDAISGGNGQKTKYTGNVTQTQTTSSSTAKGGQLVVTNLKVNF